MAARKTNPSTKTSAAQAGVPTGLDVGTRDARNHSPTICGLPGYALPGISLRDWRRLINTPTVLVRKTDPKDILVVTSGRSHSHTAMLRVRVGFHKTASPADLMSFHWVADNYYYAPRWMYEIERSGAFNTAGFDTNHFPPITDESLETRGAILTSCSGELYGVGHYVVDNSPATCLYANDLPNMTVVDMRHAVVADKTSRDMMLGVAQALQAARMASVFDLQAGRLIESIKGLLPEVPNEVDTVG